MQNNYYNISLKVRLGNIEFETVNSIHIESDINKLTDIAKIELPREFREVKKDRGSLSFAGKNILNYIKVGDKVKIQAGYDADNLQTEFTGYVTKIGADIPLVIECEDEMWQLKNKPLLNKTFAKVSLKKLLEFVAKDYEFEVLDMNLGKFMIQQASPYKVLEELKKQYGISCYFKEKTLRAGFIIDLEPTENHKFIFGKNIRQSSDLKFLTKENRKLFIKAESAQKGNLKQKVFYEFGEKGGSEITLHAPLNLNKSELKAWCEKYYNSKAFAGYEGNIKSWALPATKSGDSAVIKDPNYEDGHRDGRYLIESVVININETVGFERTNKISIKL